MSRDRSKGASAGGTLDGLGARIVAGLVLLAALGGLLGMHWRDLFPDEQAVQELNPNDPVIACIAERTAQIETLISENPAMADRRGLFVERAEAMCRSTGDDGGAPPPPPLPAN